MKIVQVMPDFGLAGAETMVENLSCGLAAEGHDVLVISFLIYIQLLQNALKTEVLK